MDNKSFLQQIIVV